MRTRILKTLLILSLIIIPGWNVLSAQTQQTQKEKQAAKDADIKKKVQDKRYTFVAQSASPMRGNIRQLSLGYDLKVAGDSVIVYLPYFGRAYAAPDNIAGGGIKFTSVKSDYQTKDRSKGGWDITIRPQDAGDVRQLNLTIFQNGSASLQVTSNNRQPISFNGYIMQKK